jgi:hypothetical protein
MGKLQSLFYFLVNRKLLHISCSDVVGYVISNKLFNGYKPGLE